MTERLSTHTQIIEYIVVIVLKKKMLSTRAIKNQVKVK